MRTSLSNRLTGWFQVGWSSKLGPESVLPLRYFGADLVAFRGKDGTAHVLDAYCQHLGANLAYGGCVVDEGIQCPFHGWVWTPEGRNARIPYQDRPNRARQIRAWPVREQDGCIYVWHDPAGRDPLWKVPSTVEVAPHVGGKEYHDCSEDGQDHWTDLQVHPQYVMENTVDPVHFQYVHGTKRTPTLLSEAVDEWTWRATIGFGSRWKDGVDRPGDSLNTLTILFSGIGLGFNVEHTNAGNLLILIATTPVDDDRTELFATYWLERMPGDDEGLYAQRMARAKAALPDDIRIWNHQRYQDPPALATEEGRGFAAMRRWSRRFYPDVADPKVVQADANS